MLRRRHPAKSGTGRPWTVAGGPPRRASLRTLGARGLTHVLPPPLAMSRGPPLTRPLAFFFFLISQTTRVRLHGKPFSRPSSCLQHLHSVGARCGGAWNQHRAAEGTSLRGGLRHRPERRGACVHGWCGQLEAGVSPPTKPHPPVGGGRGAPQPARGPPPPAARGACVISGWPGPGQTNRVFRDVSRLKTLKNVPLLLLVCVLYCW